MVNSVHIPSRRRIRHRRYATSMQDLPSLMVFLEKEIQRYPSSPTRINSVSIWSGMKCGTYSLFQTHTIKRRGENIFYISLYFPWNKWNAMYRVFWKDPRRISMLFITWRGQECTWWVLYKILFFRRYLYWCHWKQPDLRSFSSPWLHFSLIPMMLWRRLLSILIVLN